jgi:hypothetical protein
MNDRPTAPELVAAVRQFLEAELLPALTDPRLRFQTLVAANVLGIAERELATEEDHLREEWRALPGLGGEAGPEPQGLAALRHAVRAGNEALVARIRAGDFDDPGRFREGCRALRPVVVRKLQVANPRYLAAQASQG